MKKRKCHTTEEKLALVAKYRASDLNAIEFSKQEGLGGPWMIRRWATGKDLGRSGQRASKGKIGPIVMRKFISTPKGMVLNTILEQGLTYSDPKIVIHAALEYLRSIVL